MARLFKLFFAIAGLIALGAVALAGAVSTFSGPATPWQVKLLPAVATIAPFVLAATAGGIRRALARIAFLEALVLFAIPVFVFIAPSREGVSAMGIAVGAVAAYIVVIPAALAGLILMAIAFALRRNDPIVIVAPAPAPAPFVAFEASAALPPAPAARRIAAAPPASMGFAIHVAARSGHRYYRNDIPPPLADYPALKGADSFYRYEIHGEAHHSAEIQAFVGGPYDAPIYYHTNALIAREPDNAYDPNAIAVYIGGAVVGYAPRSDAAAFGAELIAIVGPGPGAVQCRALISGGFPREGEPLRYWVSLDVARPLELSGPA